MPSPSRHSHVVRGAFAAAIATFVSLLSHVAAGGDVPGALGIFTPLLLSFAVCTLLAGRKLSLLRLSVSVSISQVLFHVLFVLGTPVRSAATQMNMPAGSHHNHSMMPMPSAFGAPDSTIALLYSDITMWMLHLIGASVTILFLYRGEKAIIRLRELAERFVAWMGLRTTTRHYLPILTATKLAPVGEARSHTLLSQLMVSILSRRGPPNQLRIAH